MSHFNLRSYFSTPLTTVVSNSYMHFNRQIRTAVNYVAVPWWGDVRRCSLRHTSIYELSVASFASHVCHYAYSCAGLRAPLDGRGKSRFTTGSKRGSVRSSMCGMCAHSQTLVTHPSLHTHTLDETQTGLQSQTGTREDCTEHMSRRCHWQTDGLIYS